MYMCVYGHIPAEKLPLPPNISLAKVHHAVTKPVPLLHPFGDRSDRGIYLCL